MSDNNSTRSLDEIEAAAVDNGPAGLPENAFRELAADETYSPVMHPAHDYPEVTPYSVDRSLLRSDCGRSHLHSARTLYPSGEIS